MKDDNGIKIFTYKTIDSYSYQDIVINVYDGYLNKTSSFIYCMMPNSSNTEILNTEPEILGGNRFIEFEGYGSYPYVAYRFLAIKEGKFLGYSADIIVIMVYLTIWGLK